MYKTHYARTTFGSWDAEKVHAVVARSIFPSQNVQNTLCSDHFWKLRCRKSARRCGAKHISKSKCTKHTRSGPLLEVEMPKKCTPLWREAYFEVKNVQNTLCSDHFWKLRCRKSARRCGAKHISKSKCTKHTRSGPLLEVEMPKKCTPLWREAYFEVKMYKTPGVRTTFGTWDAEKVHAVVARSIFRSQNVQNTPGPDHSWKLRCRKSARRCGAKHISKSKCTKHTRSGPLLEVEMPKKCTPLWREAYFEVKMYKTHQVRTTLGSWDAEKVHAVVARSIFRSQNVQNTPGPDHSWKLRCRKSARRCGAKHISKSKCTKHTRSGPLLEVEMTEKVHAVVARSIFRSQNVQNTPGPDHSWKLRCRKSARRCGAKHISKSKCTKHTRSGPLLEVEMPKKCTPLWREAYFEVKMYKTHQVRTTLGSWDAEKVHAVVARSIFRSQNVQNTPGPDHSWKLRCRKSARRCGAKHISKSKCTKHTRSGPLLEVEMPKKCTPLWREAYFEVKMYKTHQVRTTLGSWDAEKVHAVVARSIFRSQNVQNTPGPDHSWKLRCRKSARRCGAKHISKSKCTKHTRSGPLLEVEMPKKCTPLWREAYFEVKMYKTHQVRTTLGSWDAEKCTPLWREAYFEVKMYKTHQVRTTLGSWDAEKVHAVVARSIFRSQNVQNTPGPDHSWKLRCRKSARRCGAKHISKSKCTKHTRSGPLLEVEMPKKCTPLWREAYFEVKMYKTHTMLGPLLEVEMPKKCTPLWRETYFEVKMYKTHQVRTTFGGWDVEKVHAVVAQSTFRSENVQNTPGPDHFWRLRCRKSARRCGAKHISKSKCTKHLSVGPHLEVAMSKKCTPLWCEAHFEVKMYKTPGVRTTFGGSDVASLCFTTIHYITLHCATYHYTTLHYTTLHSTPLQLQLHNYTPLHSTTLHYTKLHDTTLHYIALHSTTLQLQLQLHNYTPLHSTTLHYTRLHYTPPHATALNYITLHFATLHYTTLPSTTLRYTTLHSTTTTTTTTLHYTPLHSTTLHYTKLH